MPERPHLFSKIFKAKKSGSPASSSASSVAVSESSVPDHREVSLSSRNADTKTLASTASGMSQTSPVLTVPHAQYMLNSNSKSSHNNVIASLASTLSAVSMNTSNSINESGGSVLSGDSGSTTGKPGHHLRRFLGGRARRKRMLQDKLKELSQKVENHHAQAKARRQDRQDQIKTIAQQKEARLASPPVPGTPPRAQLTPQEEHEVTAKLVAQYGEICHSSTHPEEELVLGTGAGGSVLLAKRPTDGHLFAIKKFNHQNFRESLYDYRKRLEDEFRISSALLHPNLVRTYDLLRTQDESLFVIVMDYCPFDFFSMVMSGAMTRPETFCYFKQIVKGVRYMHHNGFAHRDLKLDNCVVDKGGILKLVDYGSVAVFDPEAVARMEQKTKELVAKKGSTLQPAEDEGTVDQVIDPPYSIIKARGVAGSDPYLAPECLAMGAYDPRAADIWSIAIIFCCVVLGRFPWKIPKKSDAAYSAFIAEPHETVDDKGKRHLYGPDRLLKALPSKSRAVIGGMLTLKPDQRITIDDALADSFVQAIDECQVVWDEEQQKEVVKHGQSHTHHLKTRQELEAGK